jgi:hypothetical protein
MMSRFLRSALVKPWVGSEDEKDDLAAGRALLPVTTSATGNGVEGGTMAAHAK